MTMTPKHSISV